MTIHHPGSHERQGPAVRAAGAYVRQCIARKRWQPGDVLPPLRDLAKEALVSRNTMWKAVGILANQKVLQVVPCGKITFGPPSFFHPDRETPPWREKFNTFIEDLVNGRFASSCLPSIKELCIRYQTTYRSLRKIIDHSVAAGMVKRRGNRFYLPSAPSAPAFRSTIAVFSTPLPRERADTLAQERFKKVMDVLEKEGAQSNVRIRFVPLIMGRHADNLRMIRSLKNDGTIRGHIVNIWRPESGEWVGNLNDYLDLLAMHNKPLAVLDHYALQSLTLPVIPEHVRFFHLGSYKGGLAVARHLVARGHRTVAYIGFWHNYEWSIRRLNGLYDLFAKAGNRVRVEPFVEVNDYSRRFALFNKVLKNQEITAWVCSSDTIALSAMEYLSYRKIPVPERVSLIGFDNTFLSFESRLTTIDFNMEACAYRMLRFVLNPACESRTKAAIPVEVEPTLIERGSTAPTIVSSSRRRAMRLPAGDRYNRSQRSIFDSRSHDEHRRG